MAVLRYGCNSSVQWEPADGVPPAEIGTPRGQPLVDLGAATMATLAEPIDYPALARCITPADRVVLALDRGVPQAAQVTAAIVAALVEAGLDLDGITVLRKSGRSRDGDRRSLPAGRLAAAQADYTP